MYFSNPFKIWIILIVTLLDPVLSVKDIEIIKCCQENFIIKDSGCAFDNSTTLSVPVYKIDHIKTDDSVAVSFVYYPITCIDFEKEHFLLEQQFSPSESFFLQNDGQLWVPKVNTSFNNRQFCLEYHEILGTIASICFSGFQIIEDSDVDEVSQALSLIGMVISLPFLLATFVIYALFPERNLYAKCLMCYVFALFWGYLLPLVAYVFSQFGKTTMLACRIIIIWTYFFLIASFFWMNVIAIDISLTFSGKKGILNNDRKGFLKYSIYAWGTPALLVALIIGMDNIVSPSAWYAPFDGCWLKDGYMELIFFYGPMGVLIAINVCLFIFTALKIIQTRRQTAMLRERGNETHNSEQQGSGSFKLYIKLMFAMGINWSVEIIQWIIKWKIDDFSFLWYITDICNGGFGMFIFFMFVFNKNTWKMLKKRYYMVTGKAEPAQTTTKSTETETTTKRNSYD